MDQKLGQPLWHGWPLALVLCSGTSFALGWHLGTQIKVPYSNRVMTRLECFPYELRQGGQLALFIAPLFCLTAKPWRQPRPDVVPPRPHRDPGKPGLTGTPSGQGLITEP